jgi:hypothetical protein
MQHREQARHGGRQLRRITGEYDDGAMLQEAIVQLDESALDVRLGEVALEAGEKDDGFLISALQVRQASGRLFGLVDRTVARPALSHQAVVRRPHEERQVLTPRYCSKQARDCTLIVAVDEDERMMSLHQEAQIVNVGVVNGEVGQRSARPGP